MIDRESCEYHPPLRSSSWYMRMLLLTSEVDIVPTTPQKKAELPLRCDHGSPKKSIRKGPTTPPKKGKLPLRCDYAPPKNSIRKGKPSKSHEKSRSQWLGRAGYSGPEQSVKFTYGPGGEYKSADAAGKACAMWLSEHERLQGYS